MALATVALIVAALALFFLPALLGVGSPNTPGPGGNPSASVRPSSSASVAPTPTPAPTPRIYVVAAGDTLSRIASRFGLSVDQILAANPQIRNPNRIAVGDEIVIPNVEEPLPSVVEGASPSPSA
jgi:LysM repeat protein